MKSKIKKTTKTIVENNDVNTNNKEAFSYSIYNKGNFEKFKKLDVDLNVKSVKKIDLPSEFSEETCKFIDLFRRKTVNETTEWNFYIDYKSNEIIHCFHGTATSVKGKIHSELMRNRKIASIHNHPPRTYSAPSASNFEILEHEFENYEIICAEEEFWILKAKGYFTNKTKIKQDITNIFQVCNTSNIKNKNKLYSQRLTKYINKLNQNISLTKKEYR